MTLYHLISLTCKLINKQINMEGGQSGTYLRLTRASSGPRVSVAKTYRDENETEMNISAKSQWPSSAVEYRRLTHGLLPTKADIQLTVSDT